MGPNDNWHEHFHYGNLNIKKGFHFMAKIKEIVDCRKQSFWPTTSTILNKEFLDFAVICISYLKTNNKHYISGAFEPYHLQSKLKK